MTNSEIDTPPPPFSGWDVKESGNWGMDNSTGRDIAAALMLYMTTHQAPMALGFLARDIMSRGRYGAIEVGFFAAIALATMITRD